MSNSQNITHNIKPTNTDLAILKKHFSHFFDKDGIFNFEKFKNNLSQQDVNFSAESYGLDWLGKSYARLLASDPATTLLKAADDHNNNPLNANAQNLLIKGDNLEVLKHLENAYYEKIKMIYIYPPYNTGSDGFVYADDRKFTLKELKDLTGINEEKAKRILAFTKQKSNSHSAWLTFMYPRLYLAKQLLKEDGVIFISIDDNEVAQLRLLMDEIFGEENFVGEFVWKKNKSGSQNIKHISIVHEYICCYSKNKDKSLFFETYSTEDDKDYKLKDENGKYYWKPTYHSTRGKDVLIEFKNEKINILKSIWNEERIIKELNLGNAEIRNEKNGKILFFKQRQNLKGKIPYSILDSNKVSINEHASVYLSMLLEFEQNTSNLFTPKPYQLIKHFIEISTEPSDLILDFFAGSGTTGDAVMQLNAQDGGNRKYILVQIPEPIDPKKNKTAFDFVKNELNAEPTIFEITKERLLRAANKINTQLNEKIQKLKTELPTQENEAAIQKLNQQISQHNFKIFETTPIWDDYNFEATELENTQTLFDESKLTEADINTLLITWKTFDGIALTQELEMIDLSHTLLPYTAYYGNGKLYLMHKGFTTDNLITLLEKMDYDKKFSPSSIIAFGYHFESARLRELAENVKSYTNKKNIDIDFIIRY